MGIFESRDKPKYILCVSFLQSGDVITGDSNGNLVVWGRGTNTILKLVKNVHEGPIFSLCVLKDGGVISGGGKDGKLVHFDSGLARSGTESQVRNLVVAINDITYPINRVPSPRYCMEILFAFKCIKISKIFDYFRVV